MLIGAGLGAGGAMLSGQDPLKGAAVGGAMGGASAGFGGAGVASGASAGAANGASHLAQTGAQPAATNAGGGLGATIGSGFDTVKDVTGLTNRDITMMGVNQGLSAMQPTPEAPIQHAPMGNGISRPNVDLSQSQGSLLSSNPITSGAGGQQLTPEQIQKLKQQGLL